MYLITSVDLSLNGNPLNPPLPIFSSMLEVVFKLSLLVVVLVAIMPSNFSFKINSIVSSSCLWFKSGDIFISIGFSFSFLLLIDFSCGINFFRNSTS